MKGFSFPVYVIFVSSQFSLLWAFLVDQNFRLSPSSLVFSRSKVGLNRSSFKNQLLSPENRIQKEGKLLIRDATNLDEEQQTENNKKKDEKNDKEKPSKMATKEELEADPYLKVGPSAWKWPKNWPFVPDYFTRELEESLSLNNKEKMKNEATIRTIESQKALSSHYERFLKEHSTILDLGASVNSYLGENKSQKKLSKVIGLGINEEEMKLNTYLDERIVQDLNENYVLPFENEIFDTVFITNTMEYLINPRDIMREIFRVLKPEGQVIFAFTAHEEDEEHKIKMWKTMNNDQRIWICGSYCFFSSGDGFSKLSAYDLVEDPLAKDGKDGQFSLQNAQKMMMGGLNSMGMLTPENANVEPLFAIQATKGKPLFRYSDKNIHRIELIEDHPTISNIKDEDEKLYKQLSSILWTAENMEADDKSLVLTRFRSHYMKIRREKKEEEGNLLYRLYHDIPQLYKVLKVMGTALPINLKANVAVNLITHPKWTCSDIEIEEFEKALGIKDPGEEFWAPLGENTMDMQAEDKLLLLSECVPHFSDSQGRDKIKSFIAALPKVSEIINRKMEKIKLQQEQEENDENVWLEKGDLQLITVDILITDWLNSENAKIQVMSVEEIVEWCEKELNPTNIEYLIKERKSYKKKKDTVEI